MSDSRIERYAGRAVPGALVRAMGRAYRPTATSGMRHQSHPVWEVHLLVEGDVTWFVGDHAYELTGGSVLLVPPRAPHGSVVQRFEPSDLAWLQADLPAVETGRPLGEALAADGDTFDPTALRCHWSEPEFDRLLQLHEAMINECRRPRDDSPGLIMGLLATLAGYLARRACEPGAADVQAPPRELDLMLRHIDANLDRRVSLDELTRVAGVGRTRVHRLFRRHLGQSPAAVALQHRLKRARQLLLSDARPITDIALALGFSSSQHFATAFRNRFGVRPSEFRRGGFDVVA